MSRQAEHARRALQLAESSCKAMEIGQTAGEASLTATNYESKRFLATHANRQAQIYATLAATHATLATIPDPIGSHVPDDWTTQP